jgi:hypothetical protein
MQPLGLRHTSGRASRCDFRPSTLGSDPCQGGPWLLLAHWRPLGGGAVPGVRGPLPGQSGTTNSIFCKLTIAVLIVPLARCGGRHLSANVPHHVVRRIPARAPGQRGALAFERPRVATRGPHRDYLGDGACLSGLVDVLGLDGSGPLLSVAVGPPGVVAGTFP